MSDRRTSRRGVLINVGLLAAAALIFAVCLLAGGGAASDDASAESFVGTDTTAVAAIEDSHPDYSPWFEQVFAPPSAEVESGLFALQAALGAGVFGYALGALRRRRTTPAASPAVGDDPH
ncbi:energy-coupling factor ABC transporter substrate-binding protein [Mycolicibacterium austroafricanum]|uniref:Cobalt transport protein CbiN n=1 Tax=Mycolicibacterium austroafricanum TaxID=39687 RepID=A0ABT8H8Q7_MYCAO|nr:energy-coupling factor ABC transporter substrate-binding protein [Mycolicibacterium austroafricanum]MDN4517150.1 energy-coupling factor ABC transporter substrate-binding protein [Mycolicibacterium austroafricanum]